MQGTVNSAHHDDMSDASAIPTAADSSRWFARFSWGVLAYNLLVVVWGAVVRATGSGAGCGSHWPLCNGAVIPALREVAPRIEFSHRITSGVAVALTVVGALWAFRAFPRGNQLRRLSLWSLGFMLAEALIGGVLVLLKLVAHDDSFKRVISTSLHLTNTFLLLGALVLTAHVATSGPIAIAGERVRVRKFGWLLAIVFPVGITGAIAALGDTVFPAKSLAEGMARDFSGQGHLYERLRVFHPVLAIVMVITVLVATKAFAAKVPEKPNAERWANVVMVVGFMQLVWGATNLALLAPLVMQLGHLLLADLLWLSIVSLGYAVFAQPTGSARPADARTANQQAA
jgi:heme a synthase